MSVVGLDFGSTNCVIASAGRGGVDVLLNGNSNRLNPNMSAFNGSTRSCGENASSTATSNYKNTITSMKRLIGLKFSSDLAQRELKLCPFKGVENGSNGGVAVEVSYENSTKVIAIESALAMMISHMSGISAGANSNVVPQDWVIACPSFYSDQQKRSFLDACEIVGVNCLRLMHESTASALAYGIFKDIKKEFKEGEPTYTMFIDMGSTQYTVSIVSYTPAKLTVLSTHFDANLGGRDFDMKIADWAVQEFTAKHKNAPSPETSPKAMLKLRAACEKAKKTLSPSGVKEARINLECIIEEYDFNGKLTAEKFEEFSADLLARLEGPILRCLEESKVPLDKIDTVELIGGGTRVGCVKRALSRVLKLDASKNNNGLSTTMNADEAVARGCALQSAILSPRFKVLPYEIVERQVQAVKVSWEGEAEEDEGEEGGGNEVVMFERGSNFNVTKRVTLKKSGDFTVKASYNDIPAGSDTLASSTPTDLCTFKISAPVSDAPTKIRVNVKQDLSGIITLSSAQSMEELPPDPEPEVKEGEEGKEGTEQKDDEPAPAPKKKYKKSNLAFTTETYMRYNKDAMDKAVEDEARMANADRIVAETAAKRNDLESYLYSMRDKIIGELKDFCTEDESSTFSKALEDAEEWLYSDEGFDSTKSVYTTKLDDVKKFGTPIERRQVETNARQTTISSLKGSLETYKKFVQSSDDKYAHITDDERDVCRKATNDAESWLYEMIEKQSELAQSADPVLTLNMISMKQKEVADAVNPIMHKPKPLPPKEEPKEEEAKEESKDETKTEDKPKEGETPMQTDEVPPPPEADTAPMQTE